MRSWDVVEWGFFIVVVIIAAGSLVGIFAPAEITYYYANDDCVSSHWVWHIDQKAFCPQDKATLPQFVEQFNSTLRGGK